MFDRVGVIEYDAKVASADAMFEAAIEAGADDVVSGESGHEIYAAPDRFAVVAKALEGEVRRAAQGLARPGGRKIPSRSTTSRAKSSCKLIENLNDSDDVQNVYANFEISDALVQRMSA